MHDHFPDVHMRADARMAQEYIKSFYQAVTQPSDAGLHLQIRA